MTDGEEIIDRLSINLEIEFDNNEILEVIYSSIIVETSNNINDRAKASIHIKDNKTLSLNILANDTISARAAINSYLKWINLSLKIVESLG